MLLISKGSPDADQRKRWDTAYDIAISSIIVLSWYKFALTVEVMDQRYTKPFASCLLPENSEMAYCESWPLT